MTEPIKWTGTGQASQAKLTPEMLAMIVDILPTIGSLRDLCAITGLRLDTIRKATAPFLAIMKLQGTHPKCGCGKDRFHPYGCVDSRAKSWPSDCLPGHTREQTPAMLARRSLAIEMLVAGDRQVDIDSALGMSKGGAKNYKRFLTPEQRLQRSRAIAAREARGEIRRDKADRIVEADNGEGSTWLMAA